jgi:hypothetical protein
LFGRRHVASPPFSRTPILVSQNRAQRQRFIRLWTAYARPVISFELCAACFSVIELEPKILGWQAKLGAAEDGSGPLRIVADVRPHGMYITPGTLERVIEKDDAAAAGLE